MQADAGFIEDVGDVGQAAAQVPHHLDALRFPTRQAGRLAGEAEVIQADARHLPQTFDDGRRNGGDGRGVDLADERQEVPACRHSPNTAGG
ncbi:hypothetical protein G6F35_016756 [Rhizopus arrhizus]|nr:hypothetical protein G6F35_016756 [Rhizopus arrhizus]